MIDRYAISPMKDLWTPQAQYERWLQVELAALKAMEEQGSIPSGTFNSVKERATVDIRRIQSLEDEIHHDLLAFIRSLEEQVGDPGRFIHYGLTSSDVKDTALSLQMRDALDIVIDKAGQLSSLLLGKAHQYEEVVIVGRTHGMHAEPTTLGLKFFLWHKELDRDITRLDRARAVISVGKLSGPVGTYMQIPPEIEERVCQELRLVPAAAISQILQRDRHAEVIFAVALTGATLEKIALEIRHLSRTEISEVEEPLPEGSSSMPHKRNPITSERICGLARVLRAHTQAALENVALWHERDMSHSSVERIVIPDCFMAVHYMLVSTSKVIDGLLVDEGSIGRNLELSGDEIYSHLILSELVDGGLSRAEAHRSIAEATRRARADDVGLFDVLRADSRTMSFLEGRELHKESILERLRNTSRRMIGDEWS